MNKIDRMMLAIPRGVDAIRRRLTLWCIKNSFLAKTRSYGHHCRVLGEVHMLASNVTLGSHVTLYPGVCFWGDGEIVIGDHVDIGFGTIIYSKAAVHIGNDVAIAAQCYIIDSNHGLRLGCLIREQPLESERIEIGNDVWIAAGTKVLKGARIHDGVVIGANSLVNSELPSNAIAFGVPARVHKMRE